MTEPVCQDERVGAYPGSFDPPTIAHLGIAVIAKRVARLDRVDLVVSRQALAKEDAEHAPFDLRIGVIEASIAHAPWLQVVVTEGQLISEIAKGYDVVIMGADKWMQVQDASFYGDDDAARDAAVASLATVAVFDRPGFEPVGDGGIRLELPDQLVQVSSSAARTGRSDWMTPPARKTAQAHGIWGVEVSTP